MSAPSFPIDTEDGVCVAQIDTKIPGSVESVDGAANWLELLRDGFHDARTMFSNAATLANADLSGELADAVVVYSNDLHDACNDAYGRAKNAADVIRSFADQLGWRQDDMVEHRETARGRSGGHWRSHCGADVGTETS